MKRGFLLPILALSGVAASRVLLVPEEYARVQSALIYARDDDTVSVRQAVVDHPQVHYGSINFRAKKIVVIDRDSVSQDIFNAEKGDFISQIFRIADCGDCNGDGRITGADRTYILNYIYFGGPAPIGQADVNLDGAITGADATYILVYIYMAGTPPCYEGWLGQGQVNEPDTIFDVGGKIDMDLNGYPWVVWVGKEETGDREKEVFYTNWNGYSWEPEGLVNIPDTLGNFKPAIAIDDGGTAFVVWDHQTVTDDIWYSRWNGSGWDSPSPVHVSDDRDDYSPVVSSGGGEVWVVWYEGAAVGTRYYNVFASRWNGSGWDSPMQVSPPDSTHDWWAYVDVDDSGKPHVVYSAYHNGAIYYTTYNGSSWATPILLNDTTLVQGYNPAIAIDNNCGLHVVWVGVWLHPVVDYDIYYSFSSDGVNWSEPFMIDEDDDWNDNYCKIAANSPDDIWVVWHKEYSMWDLDVFVSHFDGVSWSPEFRLNNGSTMADGCPAIDLDNAQNPWVVWDALPDFYSSFEIYYNRWIGGGR